MNGNEQIIPYIYIAFIVSLGALIAGFSMLKFKRLIENLPTSKVRGISLGFVELFGKAVPKEDTLKAPFTGKDCVYYQTLIEEKKWYSKSWRLIHIEEMRKNFYLQDDTGTVLVNPVMAKITPSSVYNYNPRDSRRLPELLDLYLRARKMANKGMLGLSRAMLFEEKIIQPGDQLYVLGTAVTNPEVSEAGRECDSIVIEKGRNIYMISCRSEKEVLRKYSILINLFLYGGFIASVLSLIIILKLMELM